MKIITIIIRYLVGLVFIFFGSNAFLHFMPMPPMAGPAGQFMGALASTGYLQVIAALQVLGGLLLLFPRSVSLGILVLGPIVVNIVLFHLFMEHSGLPMALIVAALTLFLFWRYRQAFAGIFASRPQ